MIILKHDGEDTGFCRIQYKAKNGALYCLQDEGNGVFIFYRCGQDYEPSHAINAAAFAIKRHKSTMQGAVEFLEAAGIFIFHDLLEITKEMMECHREPHDSKGAVVWEKAKEIIAKAEAL